MLLGRMRYRPQRTAKMTTMNVRITRYILAGAEAQLFNMDFTLSEICRHGIQRAIDDPDFLSQVTPITVDWSDDRWIDKEGKRREGTRFSFQIEQATKDKFTKLFEHQKKPYMSDYLRAFIIDPMIVFEGLNEK